MTESKKLTHIQHELYILLDKKIDIEGIQSELRNKVEYIHEFLLTLEALADKHILESSTEDELVELLIKSVTFILEKEIQKLDEKFLEISKTI